MSKTPLRVFLDANLIIRTGKPPGGPIFQRLIDLVDAGFISVLTTDLTIQEVAKRHASNDYEVIKEIGRSHFRKIAKAVFNADLPNVNKSAIRNQLYDAYLEPTAAMFDAVKAEVLRIDSVTPSTVFDTYSQSTGLFSGECKKDQFPDAFIFECLKAASSQSAPIIIVSDDGDFGAPSRSIEHITVLRSIEKLFETLDLRVAAPKISTFLANTRPQLLKLIDFSLKDSTLQSTDVDEAEIEYATLKDFDFMHVIAFDQVSDTGEILVIGTIQITVEVDYTHPDWNSATYDSEDKVLIPLHQINGEAELEIEEEFSMSIRTDNAGQPIEPDDFSFRNDGFIWVYLYQED